MYSIRQKLYRRPLFTANLKFPRMIIILITWNYATIDVRLFIYEWGLAKKKNPGFTILKWKKKRKGYHVFTINIPWARNSENCFNSVQRSKLPNVYATWNQTNVTVIYQRRQIACYRLFMRVFVTLKARAFHELKEVQSFLGGNTKFYALTDDTIYQNTCNNF